MMSYNDVTLLAACAPEVTFPTATPTHEKMASERFSTSCVGGARGSGYLRG